MACPKCGCKVHYQYNGDWNGAYDGDPCDERLDRCAACGEVFDLDDSAENDDDDDQQTRISRRRRRSVASASSAVAGARELRSDE